MCIEKNFRSARLTSPALMAAGKGATFSRDVFQLDDKYGML